MLTAGSARRRWKKSVQVLQGIPHIISSLSGEDTEDIVGARASLVCRDSEAPLFVGAVENSKQIYVYLSVKKTLLTT